MDSIAVASKAASLASPKVVKNAKGNIVPSSQMAHIAYGCGIYIGASMQP
jgi:ubiquitin carboxyl-terminal hydrolase 22/27/51